MSKYSDLIQETYKGDIKEQEAAPSKYSDIVQEMYGTENQTSAMKASVFSSAPINPDQAAQQYQMSRATNIPVNIVRAKENEIKQMTEINSIDYNEIAKYYPAVTSQLSNPNKSGAIRDDVDKLSYFERISKGYKTSQENTELAPLYVKQMLADIGNQKFKLTPSEENQLAFIEQEQQGNQPVEYENKGGLLQGIATFAKNIPIYTAQAIPTILANIPKTLGGAATGAVIGGGITKNPAGALVGAGYGARAGTVYGAAQLETGLAYKELKDLVDESGNPIEKTAAAGGAIATGVVNGLLELVPFEATMAPIKKAFSREGIKQIAKTSAGREYLKNIGSLALAEGATEGLQEFNNILFGEVSKAASKGDFSIVGMKDANDTEGLLKFLSDSSQRITQSVKAGVGTSLVLGTATSGVTYAKQTYDQKKQNQVQKEQIKETTQNVKESKTFNRSQELFKDVTEETLGQQNIYIPAEKVQTYFQDKTPQEVEEFYKQVPEAKEQMQDALESGGNLILKGNNAYAAFAQDAYAPLQDFASLSPENITDEAYQDAFLQAVVSNVNYDETVKKIKTEQDIVNKNIETQIQNLGIPYRDAKDLIMLTKAFYETNLKKYGNEQATKLLNNYFKNLEIKNEVYVDDVAEMLKKARAPQKALPKAGKPLLKFLKEQGGVKLGSNLAGELNALGINTKTAPTLFKKDKGIGDVDNIVASEFTERFPNIAPKIEGNYIDRQAMLDLIANEASGANIARVQTEEQRLVDDFIQQLDQMGLDLNAPDEEIRNAIYQYRQGGYNQNQTKTPAFKKWFGNSKVIDKNGEPLVVYHGTNQNFDTFSNIRLGQSTGTSPSNYGFFFTNSLKTAEEYADLAANRVFSNIEAHEKKTKSLQKAIEKAEKLKDWDKVEKLYLEYEEHELTPIYEGPKGANVMKVYLSMENPLYVGKEEYNTLDELGKIIKKAKSKKHDGLILKESDDSTTRDVSDHYVVFEPNQIKSVENKGTFDPENANIYYQNDVNIETEADKIAKSLDNEIQKALEDKDYDKADKLNNKRERKLKLFYKEIINNPDSFEIEDMGITCVNCKGKGEFVNNQMEKAIELNKKSNWGGKILDIWGDRYKDEDVGLYINDEYLILKESGIENFYPILKDGNYISPNFNNYYQKSTTAPRGQFKYLQGKPIISLFQDKNKSTLLHELGHTFLEIQKELSTIPEISEEATKDWKVLEDWLDIKDGNITVEAHEKFARGFEAYLREGKAPSIELRTAFARFFTWLTRIYKDVLQLNVKLNNEVREVFDRMLATQEAIDAQKTNPLFRVDDQVLELLNAKEKEDYLKISENAGLKAREKLTKKALRQKAQENTKFYKQQRATVKSEIRQAMEESPTYRALHFLKTGELFGAEEQVEAYKLSEEEAKFNYPELYKKLRNKGIFEKDGVSLDIAAEDFGFKDGGVMLNSLSLAKPFNQELNRATDEEMIRRFGDMLYDGTIEDEAKDAMQNEARANKILYELNGVNRKVKSYVENKEAYKQKAQEIFAKKPLSVATDSNQFYIAEVKAAREAGKALGKKDYEKAVAEKKKQLLNHYLYRESLQLKKELQTSYKKYAKYKKRPAQGKVVLEEEYREKIVELLANFGLAKMPEGVEFSVADLEAWKKEQTDLGVLGLVDFAEIQDFVNKSFKQLTTDEFRTLNDAVENLAHIARGIRVLEINGKKQELDSIANEIVELAEANLKDKPTIRGELTTLERLKETFDWVASSLIKTKNTALKIDGEKPLGKFYNFFVKDVGAAELKKNEMMDEAYKKLDEIYKKHFGGYKIPNKKTYFKDVNYSYNKQSVLSFALNWGNEINRKRIRDGFGYSDAQVTSIISSLTPNEWAFVQDMWNLINSYWPSIEALEKKLFGIAPRKQKALSFKITLDSGETIDLKGGYYPLSYTDKSNFLSDVAADIKEMMFGATADKINFHKPFTKERTEQKVSKEVDLTLRPAFQHITQVVNDISMKQAVWNSYKVINNRKVKSALANKLGLPEFKQLQSWLYDMYGRVMVQEGFLTDLSKKLRSIATTFRMGFKAATVLIQVTGFLQSIPKVGYKNMGIGLWKALGNGNPAAINKAAELAFSKSKILKDRSTTFNRDVYEVMNRLRNKGELKAKVAKFAFLGITKMQMLVDIPTWYAAYYKGLKDFKGDDAKAVEFADLTLEKTQGSSHKQALSAIERNEGAMARAFTTFYTYFNVKLNLLSESYRASNFKKPSDVANFASDFLLLFFLDGLMTEFLREGIFNGRDEDDEEDKTLHYLDIMAGSLAATVPGISQLYSKAVGYNATPAGLQGLDIVGGGIGKIGKQAIKAISEDEEVDLYKVLQGLNETGAVFGYGGGSQIDIFIKALKDQQNGEDVAPINYILKTPKK